MTLEKLCTLFGIFSVMETLPFGIFYAKITTILNTLYNIKRVIRYGYLPHISKNTKDQS